VAIYRWRRSCARLGFWIVVAVEFFLGFILISISIFIIILVVVVVGFWLEQRTPAHDGRLDDVPQADVIDQQDTEVQAGLDDQQEVGVDVQIAEEVKTISGLFRKKVTAHAGAGTHCAGLIRLQLKKIIDVEIAEEERALEQTTRERKTIRIRIDVQIAEEVRIAACLFGKTLRN